MHLAALCLLVAAVCLGQGQPGGGTDQQGTGQQNPGMFRRGGFLQPEAERAETYTGKPCTVGGTLLNAITGEPLRKAVVTLRKTGVRGQRNQVQTGVDGRFVFPNLVPGDYTLSAERTGFVGASYRGSTSQVGVSALTLKEGQTVDGIVFRLTPQGILKGTVTDEDGDPVANTQITLWAWRWDESGKKLAGVRNDRTNDAGEFRISNVSPGRYLLSAQTRQALPPLSGRPRDQREGYRTAFYPGAPDATGAVPLQVKPGGVLDRLDFRLEKTPVVTVAGRVAGDVSENGRRGAAVMLFERSSDATVPGVPSATTMARGPSQQFAFESVFPGDYILMVRRGAGMFRRGERGGDDGATARIALHVPPDGVRNLVVTPGKNVQLSVTAFPEQGSTLPEQPLHVQLSAVEEPAYSTRAQSLQPDAPLVFDNLSPVRYRIRVTIPGGAAYVRSIRWANQDVTDGIVDLSGGVNGTVELKLSSKVAGVDGTVNDNHGQGIQGALVTLIPEGSKAKNSAFYYTTNTGEQGSFSLNGLAPGDYKAYAWTNLERGAYYSPEVRAAHAGDSKSVSLDENGRQTLELRLIDMTGQEGGTAGQ